MIRRLTKDHDAVLSYLNRDPLNNIYLIHGLRSDLVYPPHGLERNVEPSHPSTTFWGAFSGERLEGVLCVDYESRPFAGYLAGENPQVLADLGKRAYRSGAETFVGNRASIEPAIAHLGARVHANIRHLNFYRADPKHFVRAYDYPVRMATRQDMPSLIALYQEYEFARKNRTEGEIEREITQAMDRSGVYYISEAEGRIVSAASVYPQTDQAGVIGAARTLPEFRGHGIYLSVRTACFEYLFRQGKVGLGMFVDTNTSMYKVLDKQGGSILSEWLIVQLKTKPPLRQRILPQRIRRWGLRIRDQILRR